METYSFDKIIDRQGTSAYKYVLLDPVFGRSDVLPLWVADMDFATPPFILNAIRNRLDREILGYTLPPKEYYNAIQNWLDYKYSWHVKTEYIEYLGGVVPGIAYAVQAFSQEGEGVMIQTPVYYPFIDVPTVNNRHLINVPLILKEGRYVMDYDNIKKHISKVKIFILCNPHNPGGVVWSKEELEKLNQICIENNVLVVSDEIHAEMTLWNKKHIPFASISESAAQNSVTLMSPSKTFNMAGIVSSYSIIPNAKLRKKFAFQIEKNHARMGNLFAYGTTIAAYEQGKDWLKELTAYLEESILFVKDFCEKNMPQIKVMVPEASFLVWLDCRDLGMNGDQLKRFMVDKAKVAMNNGSMFGEGGEGFQRLNVGTPRSILVEALNQIKKAINSL